MRLAERIVLVTGGGRGLGRTYARAFAAEGASVAIAEIDAAAATETAAGIEAIGGRAMAIETDVADPDSVVSMVDAVMAAFGRVDVLVNNAAVYDGIRCAPVQPPASLVDAYYTLAPYARVLALGLGG